jgi:hypothetical protein
MSGFLFVSVSVSASRDRAHVRFMRDFAMLISTDNFQDMDAGTGINIDTKDMDTNTT